MCISPRQERRPSKRPRPRSRPHHRKRWDYPSRRENAGRRRSDPHHLFTLRTRRPRRPRITFVAFRSGSSRLTGVAFLTLGALRTLRPFWSTTANKRESARDPARHGVRPLISFKKVQFQIVTPSGAKKMCRPGNSPSEMQPSLLTVIWFQWPDNTNDWLLQ